MLVIVQNPDVSDFAFADTFSNEPIPNVSLLKLPATFQQSWPDPSSSSITEHEGLQLRLRTTGELSTTVSRNRKDSHGSEYCHWDTKCHKDLDGKTGNNDAGEYMEEVAVDVKGLKSFILPFENLCCDSRPLYPRSNLSKLSSQLCTLSIKHYQMIQVIIPVLLFRLNSFVYNSFSENSNWLPSRIYDYSRFL